MVLLIDNYDSFTYNLHDYILQLGEECKVIRNDELDLEAIEQLSFSSAVISPGPETPSKAGITMQFIKRFYQSKPILGICLGHQAIGEFFGAELMKAKKPMHGKTSIIEHQQHFLFNKLPATMEVMRYHSLILSGVDKTPLLTIATSDGEVMGIAHPEYPIAGVQFHPESVLMPVGLSLLRNWFANIPRN